MTQAHFIGLFPTPVARVESLIPATLTEALIAQIDASSIEVNAYSDRLSHSPITAVEADKLLAEVAGFVAQPLADFGEVMFGEALNWQIKEIWTNVLDPGGRQAIHAHANSFISGVVYLTPSHPSANLVFHKNLGGTDFLFNNQNKNSRINAYNGSKWAMPEIAAGDLVLFPSYLLHEVPVNQGTRRLSVAFNAIPDRLDNLGYAIRFS